MTEAMHLVADDPLGPDVLLRFLNATGTQVAEMMRPAQLTAAVTLMRKYHDTPMDFADATLVLLAAERRLRDVLTLDRRGFSAYRTPQGRPFRLVLDAA